ncbi:hypothetical protein E2C01_028725 [Portunus trituberculatus]|uniref:Uncharacterized protein n=1 Tax=Portunus trituberculatus TaxID=210409 RepID=A0A5B7ESJ4_PORTR|nr:hypothetical protein [Portunus trituberculatus]
MGQAADEAPGSRDVNGRCSSCASQQLCAARTFLGNYLLHPGIKAVEGFPFHDPGDLLTVDWLLPCMTVSKVSLCEVKRVPPQTSECTTSRYTLRLRGEGVPVTIEKSVDGSRKG